uniref:Transient receptor potential cation channel subfamily V member 2 n=1 Tax=Myripristis murdjan TaxID=586833 RepID=A0A667ZY41_9TELE
MTITTQDGLPPDTEAGANEELEESNQGQEEEVNSLRRLLRKEGAEIIPAPMDTNVSAMLVLAKFFHDALFERFLVLHYRRNSTTVEQISSTAFTRDRIFKAASKGDAAQLHGLLNYLRIHNKRLTNPEFRDETNGKTALLKALLNLKDGRNDTVEVFLDIAEKTGDLENLINASYNDIYYKGQTALHVAIERQSFVHVKLLVQKGADVQAKANGTFFQLNTGLGFYFGELPLSLAACTNQLNMVSFLMENPYRNADLTDKDSQGNTVLHALVAIADNSAENTDLITRMYDMILIQHNRLVKEKKGKLESIENNQRLTPLKLAAKMGKTGLFRHMLQREFMEEETRPLSRKFTEWVYGPVHSSLYDMSSIDTNEDNSVLEIVVFGSDIPNRHQMLQIEPLRSLLEDKWDKFAAKLFLMNFLFYLVYLGIFTAVACYRKEGQPPFPVEDNPLDRLRCAGEVISILGAVHFFCKAIINFKRNPPNFKALYLDGFSEILFLQALLLLLCAVLYGFGRREYVGLLVLSLALAWINTLYYARGSKQMGMYSVMMQRMILGDMLHFLFVYAVFLFGFSAEDSLPEQARKFGTRSFQCEKPSYNDIRFTMLELFKFTIGMGDLEFTDHVQYKEVFYILLISYIVLTYILLLNMLIALMGDTVERINRESENIWKLQRALTILDMERNVPRALRSKLYSGVVKTLFFSCGQDESRRFLR